MFMWELVFVVSVIWIGGERTCALWVAWRDQLTVDFPTNRSPVNYSVGAIMQGIFIG